MNETTRLVLSKCLAESTTKSYARYIVTFRRWLNENNPETIINNEIDCHLVTDIVITNFLSSHSMPIEFDGS